MRSNYVDEPTVINGMYHYDGCEIVHIPGKGLGVVATKSLPDGFLIPFGGLVVDISHVETKNKSAGHPSRPMDYLLIFKDVNGKIVHSIDGHPNLYNKYNSTNQVNYAWIGSFVNHPSGHEDGKAEFVHCPHSKKVYPHTDSKAFVQLTCNVEVGTEIVAMYDYSRTLLRRCGIPHDGLTSAKRKLLTEEYAHQQYEKNRRHSRLCEQRAQNGRDTQLKLKDKRAKTTARRKKSVCMSKQHNV